MTPQTDVSVECRRIAVDSALFDDAIDLRDRVLRTPLGRASARFDRSRDKRGMHFVALSEGRVVGCLALFPDAETAELKSMAVAPEVRRVGIGAALCRHAESVAREAGLSTIVAEARCEALGFYTACGFVSDGDDYMKHGVPHRLVRKALTTRTQ